MKISTGAAIAVDVLALGLFAAACGDDDNASTPSVTATASTPTANTSATAASTAAPTARPTTTGIASVNSAIRTVLANDPAGLRAQFAFFKVKCSANPSGGIPQPPTCAAGEADGTPIDVLISISGEGAYRRASEATDSIGRWLAAGTRLYAVLERDASDPQAGNAKYEVVFVTSSGAGNTLLVADNGVTGVVFDNSNNPAQEARLPSGSTYLIPPP
jgi:hypothetical protein